MSWEWFGAWLGTVILGALLGYGIAEFRDWRRRVRERRGNFEALAAEIQLCANLAEGYLGNSVQVPTYRMPTTAYDRSFPMLLVDGVLKLSETDALMAYYINVRGFNLAVDQAQALIVRKEEDRPPKAFDREVKRAKLKAMRLRREGDKTILYGKAIDVLRAHLSMAALDRLTIDQSAITDENEAKHEG
jgi:hypothetical protein